MDDYFENNFFFFTFYKFLLLLLKYAIVVLYSISGFSAKQIMFDFQVVQQWFWRSLIEGLGELFLHKHELRDF